MAKPFKADGLQHVVNILAPPVHGYSGRGSTERLNRAIS